jgi:hypothetical protein
MAQPAVRRRIYRMRRGCMQGDFMAHHAVISRRKTGAVMTPRAMPFHPVTGMRTRRGLVMAANAVIWPMARHAALPVPFGHKPVAQRAPGVRVVARHPRVVAGNAVVPLVASKAGLSVLPRLIDVQIGRCAVMLYPVPPVGVRPGERYFPLHRSRGSGLKRRRITHVSSPEGRIAAYQSGRSEHKADGENILGTEPRNHSASPVSTSDSLRYRPRIRNCR